MSRYLIYVLLLTIPATVFAQKVYKWTDENGKTHYGDKPGPVNKSKKLLIQTNKPIAEPASTESVAPPEESVADTADTNVTTQPNFLQCMKLANEKSLEQPGDFSAESKARHKKLLALCPNTSYRCFTYRITPSKNNCTASRMKPGDNFINTVNKASWSPSDK